MITDDKKWNRGLSLLSGFMKHFPTSADEESVERFHDIVKILEEASGEDFAIFKIPSEILAPRIMTVRPGGYGEDSPGSATYSKKKYCDSKYFYSQVHALATYIGTVNVKSPSNTANPYESKTDDELLQMLVNRHIKPKRLADGTYEYDRALAIAALLRDDEPRTQSVPTHSTVINMHDSNLNYQSPGACITQTVKDFKSDDFRKLIESLKQFASTSELPPEGREQINIDFGTLAVQINAQRPSTSIIGECLASIRTILENAAGGILTSELLLHLQHYLPK